MERCYDNVPGVWFASTSRVPSVRANVRSRARIVQQARVAYGSIANCTETVTEMVV
jgi:hypothetical protein